MEPERRTVREAALALHLGLVDGKSASRARPPVASRVPPLGAHVAGQQARANLRADHVPQRRIVMRYLMRYLHGSTQFAPSRRHSSIGPKSDGPKSPWTKVRPQIATTLGSALVGPPQVRRELAAQSLR